MFDFLWVFLLSCRFIFAYCVFQEFDLGDHSWSINLGDCQAFTQQLDFQDVVVVFLECGADSHLRYEAI